RERPQRCASWFFVYLPGDAIGSLPPYCTGPRTSPTVGAYRAVLLLSLRRRGAGPPCTHLLDQLGDGRVELHVFSGVTLADRTDDRHVHRPRMHLHRRAVARKNLDRWQPQGRPVDERNRTCIDDPPRRRLADDLPELQRAVPFGEILGVRERMLVRDEDRRALERTLTEQRARRHRFESAPHHIEVTTSRQDINRVHVDEAAVVVADVDHDALARLVFRIEID